jgi:hypothetical protein
MARKSATTPDAAPAQNDAYTGMLALALIALIGGCVLLYLDYSQYEGKSPPPTPKYSVPAPAAAPPAAPPQQAAPMPPMQEQKAAEEKQ